MKTAIYISLKLRSSHSIAYHCKSSSMVEFDGLIYSS